jgi:hypothetical protein
MRVTQRTLTTLLSALSIHASLAHAAEPEVHSVNIEWRSPDIMLWYGGAWHAPVAGNLLLLGRDTDAAFLKPGTYQFWASLTELDKPTAIGTPVTVSPELLTSISVEWNDHPALRLWGFGVGIAGIAAIVTGTSIRSDLENKNIPTGLVVGGGAALGLGALLVALGVWTSDGFKASIAQTPQQEGVK